MTTITHIVRTSLASVVSAALIGSVSLLRADPVSASGDAARLAPAPQTAAATPTPCTRELLLAALTRAVASHFNFEGDLQLELLRTWTPPAKAAAVWDVNVLEFPAVPSASIMLRCQVLGDASPVIETTVVVRAQLWRDAWSTRQPVTVGGVFDASLLEARRVDFLRERDVLPASAGDRTYIFARAVTAGRMLTWRDIARRPLVKKGDLVEVTAVDGPLAVTMKALAMENGAQGETVTVRNPESRKDFAAMVVSENRVQVRF